MAKERTKDETLQDINALTGRLKGLNNSIGQKK